MPWLLKRLSHHLYKYFNTFKNTVNTFTNLSIKYLFSLTNNNRLAIFFNTLRMARWSVRPFVGNFPASVVRLSTSYHPSVKRTINTLGLFLVPIEIFIAGHMVSRGCPSLRACLLTLSCLNRRVISQTLRQVASQVVSLGSG